MVNDQIIEIARWDRCGQSYMEQAIEAMLNEGSNVVEVDGYEIQDILNEYRNYSVNGESLELAEPIWPTRTYYVYYKYHNSSGHRSYIKEHYPEKNSFGIAVTQPKGGVFCAMWSEVIIFRLK